MITDDDWEQIQKRVDAQRDGSGAVADTKLYGSTGIPMNKAQSVAYKRLCDRFGPYAAHQLVVLMKAQAAR